MADADETRVDPATAVSVVLAVLALAFVVVAVTALTDWRWATLLVGVVLAYFAWVADSKAPS